MKKQTSSSSLLSSTSPPPSSPVPAAAPAKSAAGGALPAAASNAKGGAPAAASSNEGSAEVDGPQFYVIVVGASGVGKSALVIQYVDNYFVSEYAPSVDGKFTRLVKLDRQGDKAPVQLDILDPVGLGITATSLPPATATVDGIVIAFDVTSRDSFEACKRMYSQVQQVVRESRDSDLKPPVVIFVGTKIDLLRERQIAADEATKFAKSLACRYFETSARENVQLEAPFKFLCTAMMIRSGAVSEASNQRERAELQRSANILRSVVSM